MSFVFFTFLALSQFLLSGIFLFSTNFNSVEEIIIGAINLWGLAVILLAVRSVWNRSEAVANSLKKTPQSESYRVLLATGLTGFFLSTALLAAKGAEIGFDNLLWFALLLYSAMQLARIFITRSRFQITAARRIERLRKYLRLKNARA